jgi:hypothetical protein
VAARTAASSSRPHGHDGTKFIGRLETIPTSATAPKYDYAINGAAARDGGKPSRSGPLAPERSQTRSDVRAAG